MQIDSKDRRSRWFGRGIGGLAVAFLIVDAVGKLLRVQPVLEGTAQLGYRPDIVVGGAVATHVRVGNPLLTHVLFSTYVAACLWGSLLLRDSRLRAFISWELRGVSHE
jgi:hypothetical protein